MKKILMSILIINSLFANEVINNKEIYTENGKAYYVRDEKIVSEERIRTSACNFGITHVTDRNVCLPVIKKNGKFISVFRNCRRRDSVFLFGYDRSTGIQSSCTSYVFYPHGGRN